MVPEDQLSHEEVEQIEEIVPLTEGQYHLAELQSSLPPWSELAVPVVTPGKPTNGAAAGPAPRSDWSMMGEAEHFVQFYENDAALLESLSGYIGTGLRRGDAAIVVATKPHREALEKRLVSDGVGLTAAVAGGRYVALDADEVLSQIMVNGAPQPVRFGAVVGGAVTLAAEAFPRLRIYGEMVAVLWDEGKQEAALQLEALWNQLYQAHPFSLYCAYPMRCFEGEALSASLDRVCKEHGGVIPAESYNALDSAEDRLRAIALLQQKAGSLEAEVAERKRVEAELERALRLRDEFLSAVSHDLKTPITVLKGQAQVLQRRAARGTLDQENLLKGLEQIETKSRMMARLVDDLLDVARLREGEELQLERRAVDLIALVREVVSGQQPAAGDRPLEVVTAEQALIGCWDELRLARVVENLVGNAIKYSPDGGRITVTVARQQLSDGDVAVLTVQDQGVGIDQADLPHIFERFYRGSNASGSIDGSGLGLAAVRQIVEQHGGTITVESEASRGTTFTVRLAVSS